MDKKGYETTVNTGQITSKAKKIALSALFILAVLLTQFIFKGGSGDTGYNEYQHAKRMKREANNNLSILERNGCCDKRCYSIISRIEKLNSNKMNADLKSIFLNIFDEIDKITREINILKNDCYQRDYMEMAPSISKSFTTHDIPTAPGEEISTGQQLTVFEPRNRAMQVPTAISSANPYYQPTHEGRLIQDIPDFFPNERNPRFYCSYIPTTYRFPVVQGVSDITQSNGRSSSYNSGYNDLDKIYIKDAYHSLTQHCADRTQKIDTISVCNNQVDCSDASDEVGCSCKYRVSKSKHCDGFFDCPNGEDEIGCGCHLDEFSCNDYNYHSTCLPMDKRCDGTVDCPNGKDEYDCSLIKNTIGHQSFEPFVSYGEGFLHRNWKGNWYPVCSNESFAHLSHMACVSEFGTLTNPMLVKLKPFNETYIGLFVIENPIKGLTFVKECDSGKASWVQCPITECGIKSPMKLSNEESIRRFKRYMETTGFYGVEEKNKDGRDFIKFCPSVTKSPRNYRFSTRNQYRMRRNLDTKLEKREEPRIVGGTKSSPGSWPWVVAIHKDGIYYCGGVIISPDYVLTAAHCMQGFENSHYEVRAGLLRRFSYSPQEQIRIVKDIIIHKNFNANDIAILQVNKSFMFNRWVLASCLPNQGVHNVPKPNSRCIAVGWGATKEHGKDPDDMHQVELEIFSHCKNTLDREANDLCAGHEIGGKDSCQGDSGSPLLCRKDEDDKWYIAGIVSHGKGCGRTGEQGIYTRVSKYSDWIMETTKSKDNFNMMIKKPKLNCPGYQCHNDKCIAQNFKCNGVIDCLFGDDEVKCQHRINTNTKPIIVANYLPQVIDISSVTKIMGKNGEETTANENIETTKSPIIENIKNLESGESNEDIFYFNFTKPIVNSTVENTDMQNLSVEDILQNENGQTFKCKKITQIIFKNRVCDGIADCIDLSDELGCKCKDKLLTTNPGLVCDGKIDCDDMSDEKSCQYKCKDEFYCKQNDKCIPTEKKCDGINDCPGGEDEEFCYVLLDKNTIKNNKYGSYSFIDRSKRPWLRETGFTYYFKGNAWEPYCSPKSEYLKTALEICNKLGFRYGDILSNNTIEECNILELNCSSYYMLEKQPWRAVVHRQNKILGLGVLINPSWILSSFSTQNKTDINVKLGYLEVVNEVVGIHEQNIGVYDMGFISNNHLENSIILVKLKNDTFLSHDVIPVGYYGQSSESVFNNCNCQAVGLDKNKNERRINLKLKRSCEPGWNCFSSPDKCENYNGLLTNGFVTCESPGYGVSLVSLFDKLQCPDDMCYNKMSEIKLTDVRLLQKSIDSLISGSDKYERNHEEDSCETIRCEWGNCLSWDLVNNGMDDCANGDDESAILTKKKHDYCNSTKCECEPGTFPCSSNNSICLDLSKFCDGNSDCPDGSDESTKCGSCKHYLSRISPAAICDGHLNCEDRTDEQNCNKLYDCSSPDFFKCETSKTCVPNELVCDNELDCDFGEDERDCFGLSVEHQKSSKYFGLLSQKIHGEMVPLCISEKPPQELIVNLCKEFGYNNATPNIELMEKVMLVKDNFSEVVLNNITSYNVRSSRPLVRSVINGTCPVMFISCY